MKVFLCASFAILCVIELMPIEGEKIFEVKSVFRGNWFKAYQFCSLNGMKLARISSAEEKNRLLDQIRSSNIPGDFWIGGTNLGNNQVFYWMGNSEAMSFTDWEHGEPSNMNGEENCIEMRKGFGFKWNDGSCHVKKFFVCEKEI